MRMMLNPAVGFTALFLLVGCVHVGAQETGGGTNRPTGAVLERLQGTWRGVMVGQESNDTITITVSSNSFHFHRDTNFWFQTAITLPPGTDPQQLHATIKGSAESQRDAIGKVVVAILKIEDGTLTLATAGEIPKTFDDESASRYVLRKVQVRKKDIEPVKAK